MKKKTQEEELAVARRLRDLGIPLELEDDGSDSIRPARFGLLINQVGSDRETRAFELDCGGTGYTLNLEITSNAPGLVVIRYFRLDLPWQDPQFHWLDDPADRGTKSDLYVVADREFECPRDRVINHRTGARGKLSRGDILDGLLLGVGFEPIPDCFRHGSSVDAMLSIVDQFGRSHSSEVSLWIERSVSRDRASWKAMGLLRRRGRSRLRLGLEEKPQAPVQSDCGPSRAPAEDRTGAVATAPVEVEPSP